MVSRAEARAVAQVLADAGHEVVFAGGCVRDRILDRPIGDIDIATSAAPTQVTALFERTVAVGAAFGVILVVGQEDSYEVASFRRDVGIGDGRHPAATEPADLAGDVARRDFTINGLVEDPFTGDVTDLVGGRADLAAGVIRAIGDPALRFREDGLRVLRALRFAARLGFEIEAETWCAIQADGPERLAVVSAERVRDELAAMLTDRHRAKAITLLTAAGLTECTLPEAHEAWHQDGSAPDPRTLTLLTTLGEERVALPLGLAALHLALPPAVPAPIEALARRLRLSSAERTRLAALHSDRPRIAAIPSATRAARRRLLAEPHTPDLCRLHGALAQTDKAPDLATPILAALTEELGGDTALPPPLVTGADLLAAGHIAGPALGQLLTEALDAQLEGLLLTPADASAWISSHGPPEPT